MKRKYNKTYAKQHYFTAQLECENCGTIETYQFTGNPRAKMPVIRCVKCGRVIDE